VPEPVRAEQALLWGFGRTIDFEMPELRCLRIDLDPALGEEQAEVLLEELCAGDEERELAFRRQTRYVARLTRHEVDTAPEPLSLREGTYLITGGTGGLGLIVAGWLVGQGARHLALVSRRGASSAEARQAIDAWRREGIDVAVIAADVSQWDETARMIDRIRTKMPPLRGIVHAAGVLDDGVVQRQTWAQFDRVIAAKARGAEHLHRLTRRLPLDFFVSFSSIASLLGSPGQANYAAANAFVDALMHRRRALNLPGLSINWGPWANRGMAADLGTAGQHALARRGLRPLEAGAALDVMSALLRQQVAQVAVLDVDWRKYARETHGAANPSLLELLNGAPPDVEFRSRLERVPAGERCSMLLEFVGQLVGELVGVASGERVQFDQGFYDMGLDSLSVMQMRNRLQSSLGVSLPATMAFKYPSVQALSDHLAEQMRLLDGPADIDTPADHHVKQAEPTAELAATLEKLSEGELADRLAQKVASLRKENVKR
jgi:NAD(P)-dependent dehydrogenase (short-subunit alcohol dehydrogenase family)/acyl carrier protein